MAWPLLVAAGNSRATATLGKTGGGSSEDLQWGPLVLPQSPALQSRSSVSRVPGNRLRTLPRPVVAVVRTTAPAQWKGLEGADRRLRGDPAASVIAAFLAGIAGRPDEQTGVAPAVSVPPPSSPQGTHRAHLAATAVPGRSGTCSLAAPLASGCEDWGKALA